MNDCSVKILPGFYIGIAVGILLIPLPWLAAWLLAAAVHELFHLLALTICGFPIVSVEIGGMGAQIETDMDTGLKMTLCALAGPVGGLLLLVFLRTFPRLALCGLIQSIYNLLPVYPLDGNKALSGLLVSILPRRRALFVLTTVEYIMIAALLAAGVYATVKLKLGLVPILMIVILIVKNKKIPCKEMRLRVQ